MVMRTIMAGVAMSFVVVMAGFISDDQSYEKEIRDWQVQRTAQLKKSESPLNLAGLFWLDEGANTFGSGTTNKIVFPAGSIPAEAGSFILKNEKVSIEVKDGVQILSEGKPAKNGPIFENQAKKLEYGNLKWFVLKSGDKTGIRLYDSQHENQKKFQDVERYKISQEWRVKAKFTPHLAGTKIDITNIIGQTIPRLTAGTLKFKLKGKEYNFEALDGDELFIVFGDQSNGKGSYPAGRFLYAPKPGQDGEVILDFNKAINPNCAFTPYALCPLPPKSNRLSVAVTAGEKKYELE